MELSHAGRGGLFVGMDKSMLDGGLDDTESRADEQAQSLSGTSVGTASTSACQVFFPSDKAKQLTCKLCQQTAGSENPLHARSATYGSFRPWAKYKAHYVDDVKVKVPAGRLCLLCLNCYRQLGLALSLSCQRD